MILITGKSTLAKEIAKRLNNCTIVGRPDYDFSVQADCDRLLNDFPDPEVVINTFGIHETNPWNCLVTNFVAPAYLTSSYYNKLSSGQIINISSASAWWPSYPDIPENRFFYSVAKFNLSEFNKLFNRSIRDNQKNVVVTTIDTGRFDSKMSGHTGMEINLIVDQIKHAIDTKVQYIAIIK